MKLAKDREYERSLINKIILNKHKEISDEPTPKYFVKRRPDGFDYVDEAYMRHQLSKHFPIWSWIVVNTEFLGSEWVVITGELQILESDITRKFGSMGATRVQFKKDRPHTPENIVDIDKNVASANTNAFKRAVNRLCNIADDIYQKHIEDITLSDEQKENLIALTVGIDIKEVAKVKKGIDNGSINTSNYDAAIRKINNIKE